MENIDSYLFMLKKFLGNLLMPMPMILLLLLWALLLLLRRKTRWFGILIVFLVTALLFAASYPPLVAKIISPLEQQFPSYQPSATPTDYVAVLGNTQVSTEDQPVTSELKPIGIVRLAEGIRVYRMNPGSKLIFTGFHFDEPESYPEKLKQLAIALGVPENDIHAFTGPKDTAEEAELIAGQFGDSRLVLVTSASHMPRAMALFQRAGLNPTPAPTEHLAKPVRSKWLFPSAETLAKTHRWAYEQLGLLWTKLIGKTVKTANNTSTDMAPDQGTHPPVKHEANLQPPAAPENTEK
jgi:uncharacterized SAM-binding protein YcdF (DUF218 family)